MHDSRDALNTASVLGSLPLNEWVSHCGGSLKLRVTGRQWTAFRKLFLSCFLADHMTLCCTVCLGPDFQTVPASSGVSVTSTITLLLFHSHKPLCQSSQNQTDGASWQQKACKSWIIWLEILFNYSTKWPSWRGLNACCLLYNMCKQLLQYSTNNELHKRWKLRHCYLKGLWSIHEIVQFMS